MPTKILLPGGSVLTGTLNSAIYKILQVSCQSQIVKYFRKRHKYTALIINFIKVLQNTNLSNLIYVTKMPTEAHINYARI
jgi:hypothetical protein